MQVPVEELAGAQEVRVRAWDETMNTQPEKPSWNLIGMMNNRCEVLAWLYAQQGKSRGRLCQWQER